MAKRRSIRGWWAALTGLVAGVGLALAVPAMAWAAPLSPSTLAVADEVARRRPRIRGVGSVFGALCCLAVVVIIVLVLLMMMRRRRR